MKLNNKLLIDNPNIAERFAYKQGYSQIPEKVIQFGEGNFLRAFSDWMIQELNNKGLFKGRIVAVQPIEEGLAEQINDQDGLYTLIIRGIQDGKQVYQPSIISTISRCINPYSDWDAYLKCAENPNIKYVISNTTEVGIAYNPSDKINDKPALSFPGKLTQYLYHRYNHFNGSEESGMIIFACELIDRNGDELKKIIMQLAEDWKLPETFKTWISEDNYFLNTLVDRIVPGYPANEIEEITKELGYEDKLITTAECFYLWVIEGPEKIKNSIPFKEAGLNVLWTDDIYPYKTRKVRILNGTHTTIVPVGLLYGIDTVGECIKDKVIGKFMKEAMYNEIVPSVEGVDVNMLKDFANSIEDRFKNPYIGHSLFSISLNGISKFKERIIPSILGYYKKNKILPEKLTFSLAATIAFYKGTEIKEDRLIANRQKGEYQINDEKEILEIFKEAWLKHEKDNNLRDVVESLLQNKRLWDMNLLQIEGLYDKIYQDLKNILFDGIKETISKMNNLN